MNSEVGGDPGVWSRRVKVEEISSWLRCCLSVNRETGREDEKKQSL